MIKDDEWRWLCENILEVNNSKHIKFIKYYDMWLSTINEHCWIYFVVNTIWEFSCKYISYILLFSCIIFFWTIEFYTEMLPKFSLIFNINFLFRYTQKKSVAEKSNRGKSGAYMGGLKSIVQHVNDYQVCILIIWFLV